MPDTNRTKAELLALYADNSTGDIGAQDLRDGVYSWFHPQSLCNGRLTLESGVAVSITDQSAKTSVYFTPFLGNLVGLYDGLSWKLHVFTERTLALGTVVSGKNYDVFLYDNAGTLTLELSTAWTSDTARADALTTQDGVYVKFGATTRRYLGTIRTTSTTTTEDSEQKRLVWNQYNRQVRKVTRKETADSWTYTTHAWRQANNSTANQIDIVCGLSGEGLILALLALSGNSVANISMRNSFGENSTTVASGNIAQAETAANTFNGKTVTNSYIPRTGYSFYAWLEDSQAVGTTTWYGDVGDPSYQQSGIQGAWLC